jgi:hypothetical protein
MIRLVNPAAQWGAYDEGRHVAIYNVQVGRPQTFAVLGESCVVPLTHFLIDIPPRGRTVPCHSDPTACVGCKRFLRPIPTPFLACWWEEPCRHVLLCLTRQALRDCPDLQPCSGTTLRGRHITVRRVGRSTYAPLEAMLSDIDPDGRAWPIGCDELAVLGRLWHVEQAGLVLVDEAA